MWPRRRKREQVFSEAESYARSYGKRDGDVHVVRLPPRRPRYQLDVTGESLRAAFERRLRDRHS